MKKLSLFLLVCMIPSFAFAATTTNLSYGMTGASVVALQKFLIADNYLTGTATGNFYSLTRIAVEKYQTSKGITPTGTVGPLTRAAIAADEAAGTMETASAAGTASSTPTTTASGNAVVTPPVAAAPVPLTGTLTLVPSTSSPVTTTHPAATKAKIADLTLANGTSEPVNLKTIEADFTLGSDGSFPASNVYAVYNGVTTSWNSRTSTANIWNVSGLIPSAGSIDISIYGDIDPGLMSGSPVASNITVTGVTKTTLTPVNATASASVLVSQNSLSVAAGSGPAASIIDSAEKKMPVGVFTLTSVGAPYAVTELKFVIPTAPIPAGSALAAPPSPIVTSGTLIDTATQATLASGVPVTYNGNNYLIDFSNLNVSVPSGGTKSVTLAYDVGAVASPAQANTNISPVLAYVKATTGNTTVDGSATVYPAIPVFYGGVSIPIGGITVNSIYAFKGLPSISSQAATSTVTSETALPLYTFTVSADKAGGAVSFKQIMLNVTLSDPNGHYPLLQNFSLFKNGANYSGNVQIGDIDNSLYKPLTGTNGMGIGSYPVVVTFINEETVSAGASNTYTLKADGADFTKGPSNPTVTTFISADSAQSMTGSYLRSPIGEANYGLASSPTSTTATTTYNFLWSDRSATYPPHTDMNGSSSGDWYDGFGVPQTLSTQTLSINTGNL